MNLPLTLAWRLYRKGDASRRISRPAVRIATLGVALGVAVMILSVAVVVGFKREIQQKVVGMSGHILVFNDQISQEYESFPILMNDSMFDKLAKIKGVSHAQRYCHKPGMLKTNDSFDGVILRGYGKDFDARFLTNHLVEGKFEGFSDSAVSNRIYVSQIMAKRLNLSVGSKVYAYFFDKGVRTRHPEVAGIYCTNIKEFDNNTVFTDIYTVRKLCGFAEDECSGVEIHLSDFDMLDEVDLSVSSQISQMRDDSPYPVTAKTVRQLYAPLFSWLSLLDTDIWVILALMTAVAVFTMISGLLIIILEQTQFIGTMKALGATNGTLRSLFLYLSSFIITKGILLGNFIGLGLIVLQQTTGIIRLDAENYYVDRVPVDLNWLFVLAINLATAVISVIVLILPSFLVSRIHPARSIRFE